MHHPGCMRMQQPVSAAFGRSMALQAVVLIINTCAKVAGSVPHGWPFLRLIARRKRAATPHLIPHCHAQAAVKILWESCIKPADFPRSVAACVAVLRRVQDKEASIQDVVTKTFHSLWFAPTHAAGEGCAAVYGLASAAHRPSCVCPVALTVWAPLSLILILILMRACCE